ncbi:MAG: DUF362 domain-containing protein [Dehalococcoidia bacterium]|nr:MAG: DUF362 domain-containing protein [Dehalococcoidia bacterium]
MIQTVAISRAAKPEYPENPPFHPPAKYPEYPYTEIDQTNGVYQAVRETLIKLGMDNGNYSTANWNPLGDIIRPGDSVVIKPNFVSEPRSEDTDPNCIVTHASVIRPVIDYCLIALKGQGSLTVADAPQSDSDFETIKDFTKIQDVIDFINYHSSLKVSLIDLREEYAESKNGVVLRRLKMNGDPLGYAIVNLGNMSAFHDIENYMNRIYGAYYDVEKVREHHGAGRHEYCVSNTALSADVIINIPKLKTHKKAGVTVSLKNIVGINGNKNYLPHYRFGSKEEGGDEYELKSFSKSVGSRFYQTVFRIMARLGPNQMKLMVIPRIIYSLLKSKNITRHRGGSWYGNDTIWRTIVDLNRILFYADKKGNFTDSIQRKYLSIVDGIIGGEDDGPLFPTAKLAGFIIGGFDPVQVDRTASAVMGFDYRYIPHIVASGEALGTDTNTPLDTGGINMCFKPPEEWRGKI